MLSARQSSIEAEAEGGSFTIQVASNVEWSPLCSESWIKLKRENESNTLVVTIYRNSGTDPRSGQIKLSSTEVSATISVTQKQQNTIVLDEENPIIVPDTENTFTIDTRANTEYMVEIPEDAVWLTVSEGTKAMESRTITFHADRNSEHEARSAQVNLKADKCDPVSIIITQLGSPFYFGISVSGINSFKVPIINNNTYPAKVRYNGQETDYSSNMVIQFTNTGSNTIQFEVYQLNDISIDDIVGVDYIDLSGM